MHRLLPIAALAAIVAPLPAQTIAPVNPAAAKAVETITEADVAKRIRIVAADSMMGRDTPSPGLEKTAQYVADEFKKFGLKPGGDGGTWFQHYPFPNDGSLTAVLQRTFYPRDTMGLNAVGMLEGSDPELKNEYIVISAHMDHIGVSRDEPDTIYNGADDNGSGTVGVVELAEAFSRPGARPKRSIIFLTVSGEEKGLWGSSYFTSHPPVPIERIVANFNIDMIGRNWKDTVAAIGKEHSDLGATVSAVAKAHPELKMTPIDDIWPGQGFYGRSDHINFARKGVPVLFFFSGVHKDYHQASDSPEKIDAEKEARILRLIFYLGQQVGNADEKPKWTPDSYQRIVKP